MRRSSKNQQATSDLYPKNGLPWTKDEDNRLLLLYEKKRPLKQISRQLGRSPSAVHNRLYYLLDREAQAVLKQGSHKK